MVLDQVMDLKENHIDGATEMKSSGTSTPPLAPQMQEDNYILYKLKYTIHYAYVKVKQIIYLYLIHH